MKRIVLLLSIFTLIFTSCEGPTGPMGPQGEPGEDITFFVKNFTVRSQDWERYSSGKYVDFYRYQVNVDIGDYAYEEGLVNVYIFQDDDGYEIQSQLPYWIQYTEGDNTWLEGFNYDFDAGTVVFYVDWAKGASPPTSYFRVVVAP